MNYHQAKQVRIPFEELTEHSTKKKFYQTQESSLLYIAENGLCWDDERRIYVKPSCSSGKYPTIRHLGKNWNLHSLLGNTFLMKPEVEGEIWINHRDGNKENFDLKNLEWTSASQNLLHAYENGLRSDNKQVKLKDLIDGSVVEFNSLNACARFLNKAPSVLSVYLKRKAKYPFIGRYELRWLKDEWVGFTAKDTNLRREGVPRAVLAEHLDSGTKVIYRSASVAEKETKVDRSSICASANGKRKSEAKGYRFTWIDEFKGMVDGIPVVSPAVQPRKYREPARKPKKILVIDVRTGQEEVWDSSESFSNHLGVTKSALQASVFRKNGHFRNYKITYLS